MKPLDLKIYRFQLPLTQPLFLRGRKIVSREGLALRLMDNSGIEGWGNIMPLPGVSLEDLEVARKQLQSSFPRKRESSSFNDYWIPVFTGMTDSKTFRKKINQTMDSLSLAPSVHYGMEAALWNLAAATQKKNLSQWLSFNPSSEVLVNGLLHGPLEKILREAKEMVSQGYQAVKLKVGNPDIKEDIERTTKVREILGADIPLRLDANRSWDRKKATEFAMAVSDCAVDYIEEPFLNPEEFASFVKETSMPVALDETLFEPGRRLKLEGIKAFILKPPFLGGLERTFQWVERAKQRDIVPVISCAFESGIGVQTLAHIGSVLVGNIPLGLDPYRWLERDLLKPRIEIHNGKIQIDSLDHCKVDLSQLEEIS
jgi:o-succinylbenzoate synthase